MFRAFFSPTSCVSVNAPLQRFGPVVTAWQTFSRMTKYTAEEVQLYDTQANYYFNYTSSWVLSSTRVKWCSIELVPS